MKLGIKVIATLGFIAFGFSKVYGLSAQDLSQTLKSPQGRLAKIHLGGGIVYDTMMMEAFYQPRNYAPLWLSSAEARARLTVVRELLQKSYVQGFDPSSYWHPKMEAFYNNDNGNQLSELAFELLVSESLMRYVRSINIGQVEPVLVDDDIKLSRKSFSVNELNLLRTAIEGPVAELGNSIAKFEPQIPLYQHLKSQLTTNKNQFTQDQLNKMAATLEKLRWLPNVLGERYAFVNLAMTELKIIENGSPVLVMKTVNGRPVRRTPMMIDTMKRVEINPTWTVPLNLAIWDKLPKIKADIGFLARNHIKVFRPGSRSPIEDVASINWNSLSRDYFPYILQQQAGPGNVLGKVKFPLTNGYSIYLHDTDERNLFSEASPRLRSSGCVRLQKPMEMAAYLLKDQTVPLGNGWVQADGTEFPIGTTFTESILMSRVAKSTDLSSVNTIGIQVEKPLPLYTAFLTADMDDKGGVRFIQDKYKQDARLLGILKNKGSGTPQAPVVAQPGYAKLVPVSITGELGPTQLFGNVVAVRCAVMPYKGCVDLDADGNEAREEFHFSLNQEVKIPEGYYIVGAENTMLPGWLEVKCKEDLFDGCEPVVVNLEKISIPEDLAQSDEVFVYRDLTSIVEQNKILSQSFHNGQALIKETPISAKNFYVPGLNQMDVVQRLNTDFCNSINGGSVRDVAPEVAKYCSGLSRVIGMAEYIELPVEVENERTEGTSDQVRSSKAMKVFQFPKDDSQGQAANQWSQRWVGAPGNWIDFSHRRYLVAAPLFPRNIPPEKRFVAVLPGQYRILAVNSEGSAVGQAKVRTENIDENYERIARKVVLGEE